MSLIPSTLNPQESQLDPQLPPPPPTLLTLPTENLTQIFTYLLRSPSGAVILRPFQFHPSFNKIHYHIICDPMNPYLSASTRINTRFLSTCRRFYNAFSNLVWKQNILRLGFDYRNEDHRSGSPIPWMSRESWYEPGSVQESLLFSTNIMDQVVNLELTCAILHRRTTLLKGVFEKIRDLPNLKKLSLDVDPVFDGRSYLSRRVHPREWKGDDPTNDLYHKMLDFLQEVAEYLAHLEREIHFTSFTFGDSKQKRVRLEHAFWWISVTAKDWAPALRISKDLSKAFGAPVFLDRKMTHDKNGHQVRSIFTKVWDGKEQIEIYEGLSHTDYVRWIMASEYLSMGGWSFEDFQYLMHTVENITVWDANFEEFKRRVMRKIDSSPMVVRWFSLFEYWSMSKLSFRHVVVLAECFEGTCGDRCYSSLHRKYG